ADAAWRALREGRSKDRPLHESGRGRPSGRPVAVVGLLVALLICGDIAVRGAIDGVRRARSSADNHRLDDRAAVRWLNAQKQPGDVWMTTHYGVPAVWWY